MNEINNLIPKMRTINESVSEIKSRDAKSAITPNFIRLLVKQNKIRYVSVGTRILVNFDDLLDYIQGGQRL